MATIRFHIQQSHQIAIMCMRFLKINCIAGTSAHWRPTPTKPNNTKT